MKIIWGGKIESNGKHHSENRSVERGITQKIIIEVISKPDYTETQSIDCDKYYREINSKTFCVVAVKIDDETFEVITVF